MGSLFGEDPKQETTQSTGPWEPQQGHILQAFRDARDLYETQQSNPLSEQQRGVLSDILGWQSSTGRQMTQGYSNAALGASGALGKALGRADQLYGMATADPTQATYQAANTYANNPAIDAQIDAAGRDISRNLGEQTLPTLNRAASAGGNLNSSRAGMAEAMATRGAQDRMADISSRIRGNAYTTGLQLGANQQQQRFANAANANTQLSGLFGQGMQAGGFANNLQSASNNSALGAADTLHNADWAPLQRYWGLIGNRSWGGQSTGTTEQSGGGGIMGKVGQGLGVAASAASLFSSDRRLKENVVVVGEHELGIPIYEYNYTFEPATSRRRGVMAQDLQEVMPEAVIETDSGYLAVNYGMIGGIPS